MNTAALKITNTALLSVPAIDDLFHDAFASSSLVPTWQADVRSELERVVRSGTMQAWIGLSDDAPRGLLLIAMPDGLYYLPQVYLIYNAGPKSLAKTLAQAGLGFLKGRGFRKFWGLNGLTDNDAAYARLFRYAGEGKAIGSVMSFETEHSGGRDVMLPRPTADLPSAVHRQNELNE